MKFTSIVKSIILEQSRMEVLLDKLTKPQVGNEGKQLKPFLSKDELFALIGADPDTKLNDVDLSTAGKEELKKVKVGKFSNWMVKNYLKPTTETNPGENGYDREVKEKKRVFIEDLFKVKDDLKKFTKFNKYFPEDKRDINKFTIDSLFQFLDSFELPENIKKKLEKTELKKEIRKTREGISHPGGEIEFEGPNYTVIKIDKDKGPLANEAATWYGGFFDYDNGESRWCTSPPNASYTSGYLKNGPLYVIFANDDKGKVGTRTGLPQERYQFHFPSNQYMDRADRPIDLVKELNGKFSELKDYFKPEFAKGLTTGGEKLVIDNFSSGAVGKFIALYGLDDLIKSLPDTLKEFQIQNRDKNDIIVKIPEEISRFKELNMILLDNCIDSIPESICTLSNLRFLALINNKKLTSVPGCIVNLDKLYFLNLKGSDNVSVPEEIKAKGTDMGGGMWDLKD